MLRYIPLVLLAAGLSATTSSPVLSQTHSYRPPLAPAPPVPPITPVAAQALLEPLKPRIQELLPILKGTGDYDAYFTAAFIAQVPKAKFDQVNAQLTGALGPVQGIEAIVPAGRNQAMVTVGYRDGTASMAMVFAESPPYQVSGLLVTGTTSREASVAAVVDSIKALPGTTNFAIARLDGSKPTLIASHNPDHPLALGSAFKLVILAELVRATNASERKWSDTVTLDGSELPGGVFTQVPQGTQVPLDQLATMMISLSDNSATDVLLKALGRTKVEAMLPVVGVAKPSGMRPFLGTMEAFKLKGIDKGALGQRYIALDEAGRRAMLDKEVAAQPGSAVDPNLFKDGKPVMIDTIEWFASASDMVRVMDWLRRNSEGNPTARQILSVNPGIGAAAAKWRYAGFKGGSEPGVINMTLLLQGKDGGWYALSGGWNNAAAAVDSARFAGLLTRAAELAAP
ncbi:MAG TPA: serine hydrolase [Sphingomicrobium sp.]